MTNNLISLLYFLAKLTSLGSWGAKMETEWEEQSIIMNEKKNVNMKGKEEHSPCQTFNAWPGLDSWIIILPCFNILLYFHTAWKEVKPSEWFAEEHGLK